MNTKFCPNCGSTEIYPTVGFETGMIYSCKKCGFSGALFPEKETKPHKSKSPKKKK